MSIPNDFLAKLAMEDIINANSTGIIKLFCNTLFDIKNLANFYKISFSIF